MKKITIVLLCFTLVGYGQQTISFESGESYNLGDINGQNNWFTSASGPNFIMNQVISDENSTNGDRSLKLVEEPGFPAQATPTIGAFYPYPVPVDVSAAVFSFDFNINQQNSDTSRYLVSFANTSNGKTVTQIQFDFDGDILVLANTESGGGDLTVIFGDTNVDWSPNTWVNVRIEINGAGLEVFVDNVSRYTGFVATPNFNIERVSVAHDNFESVAYFDNFRTNDEALSTDDFVVNNTSFRYLGSSKELFFQSSSLQLDELRVFNMAGQEVVKTKLSGNEDRVNADNLPSGIYIAQVVTEGRISSFKFSKY